MFGSQSADVRAWRCDLMLVLMVDLQHSFRLCTSASWCPPTPLVSILGLTHHKPVIHYLNHKKVNLWEKRCPVLAKDRQAWCGCCLVRVVVGSGRDQRPLQLEAASASQPEDNQPAVFADSRPPHFHSLSACSALQALWRLFWPCRPFKLGCSVIMSDYSCCIISIRVMYSITLFGCLWHFLEMLSIRKKFAFWPHLPSTEDHCSSL